MKQNIFRFIAWTQLAISVALAGAIIWAYMDYRPRVGELLTASSETLVATANVIVQTADTVQANEALITDTQQLLVAGRKLVEELNTSARNQAAAAPAYAEGLLSASALLTRAGAAFSSLGDGLMFSVPSGIEMEGYRPLITMNRPLQAQAQSMKQLSQELSTTGNSIAVLAPALTKDAQNLAAAIIASSNQMLKLIDTTEKSLADLHKRTLPDTIANLRSAADNLSVINSRIHHASMIAEALLIIGLLLAAWCLLHSIVQLNTQSQRRIT